MLCSAICAVQKTSTNPRWQRLSAGLPVIRDGYRGQIEFDYGGKDQNWELNLCHLNKPLLKKAARMIADRINALDGCNRPSVLAAEKAVQKRDKSSNRKSRPNCWFCTGDMR